MSQQTTTNTQVGIDTTLQKFTPIVFTIHRLGWFATLANGKNDRPTPLMQEVAYDLLSQSDTSLLDLLNSAFDDFTQSFNQLDTSIKDLPAVNNLFTDLHQTTTNFIKKVVVCANAFNLKTEVDETFANTVKPFLERHINASESHYTLAKRALDLLADTKNNRQELTLLLPIVAHAVLSNQLFWACVEFDLAVSNNASLQNQVRILRPESTQDWAFQLGSLLSDPFVD